MNSPKIWLLRRQPLSLLLLAASLVAHAQPKAVYGVHYRGAAGPEALALAGKRN
ncbi:MAG: hypothetical protein L0Z53_15650 [Acidobacteriales bacterium]|nr:hypothetical protein [Terriglobales bacterium]